MFHLVARFYNLKPQVTDPWVQEELIFPPLPADKSKQAYYEAQDPTNPSFYRTRSPAHIEYYLPKE